MRTTHNSPWRIVPLKLWSFEEQKRFIDSRISLLINNESREDDDLDLCSSEEMWEKPAVYAVKKEGRKTSVRNFEDEQEAADFIADHKDKDLLSIETRTGERTRCESFCAASKFCSQFQQYKKDPL